MITKRFEVSVMAGALLVCLGGLSAASAAPAADRPSAANPASSISTVAAVTEAEDDSVNCTRLRRRMFVEGEGWIVRRVTTCR